MLQILEDGTLSDSSGRAVDFKNTIIILTSNVGESWTGSAHRSGFSSLSAEQAAQNQKEERRKEHLKNVFHSEFLNRLDAIIWFAPLKVEHLKKITKLLLEKTSQRLSVMEIKLVVDEGAVEAICSSCSNADLGSGARPLRRAINENIENLIALKLLRGELSSGNIAHISHENEIYQCTVEKINQAEEGAD